MSGFHLGVLLVVVAVSGVVAPAPECSSLRSRQPPPNPHVPTRIVPPITVNNPHVCLMDKDSHIVYCSTDTVASVTGEHWECDLLNDHEDMVPSVLDGGIDVALMSRPISQFIGPLNEWYKNVHCDGFSLALKYMPEPDWDKVTTLDLLMVNCHVEESITAKAGQASASSYASLLSTLATLASVVNPELAFLKIVAATINVAVAAAKVGSGYTNLNRRDRDYLHFITTFRLLTRAHQEGRLPNLGTNPPIPPPPAAPSAAPQGRVRITFTRITGPSEIGSDKFLRFYNTGGAVLLTCGDELLNTLQTEAQLFHYYLKNPGRVCVQMWDSTFRDESVGDKVCFDVKTSGSFTIGSEEGTYTISYEVSLQ